MSSKPANNPRGFTLIEVLISISLLAMISMGIYQATTETYHLRDVLLNEGDFYNGIRLALGVMERDLSMIYTPNKLKPPSTTTTTTTASATAPPPDSSTNETTKYWIGTADKYGIRQSHFTGTDVKLSFISNSHLRIYKDSPESDFAQIAYELQPAHDPLLPDTYILVKTESPNAFNEDEHKDKMRHVYLLLRGIKQFKYRYYRKDKDRWENAWDNDKEDFKDIYPDMIEIKIEVIGPSRLDFEGLYKFRPEFPLHVINPST